MIRRRQDKGRRDFIKGAAAVAAVSLARSAHCGAIALEGAGARQDEARQSDLIAEWDEAAAAIAPQVYGQYLRDGKTHGLKALEDLEAAFGKVMREVGETVVTGDAPAIWSVYNMGYVVKTREALFSIDLVHRRDRELAGMLDFAGRVDFKSEAGLGAFDAVFE